jgi:hypothetical protein
MRWLIFALFVVGAMAAFAWREAAERKFTYAQKSAFGILAIAAFVLVLVLGNTML